MKDVFLSYSSKDREKAALIERAFEAAGISVFWDQEVPPGRDWDSWIREHLTGAKVAVVLWSKASVASANVKHEAMIAKETGKLIPVLVENLSPSDFPMGMYLTQAALLTDYRGGAHPGMAKLIAEVEARLSRGPSSRPDHLVAPPRTGMRPGAMAALLAVPVAFLALGALALQNRPTVCAATGLLCTPTVTAAQPAPPPAQAATPLDPIDVLQGDWAWTGVACGQGPQVALDVVDGEKTLLFTFKETRFRHAIAGVDGRTLKTIVAEPDEARGTTYRMEVTPDGKGVALYEGAQTAPDTWEKCP